MAKQKEQLKEHSTRRMTVLRGSRHMNNDKISCFRLMGKWLYDAGFCPGDKILIKVNEGKLEIHNDSHT